MTKHDMTRGRRSTHQVADELLEEDSEYYQRKLKKSKDMSGGKGGTKGGKRDLRRTFQQDFELEEDSEYYQRKLKKSKDMSGGKGGSKGGKRDLRHVSARL